MARCALSRAAESFHAAQLCLEKIALPIDVRVDLGLRHLDDRCERLNHRHLARGCTAQPVEIDGQTIEDGMQPVDVDIESRQDAQRQFLHVHVHRQSDEGCSPCAPVGD